MPHNRLKKIPGVLGDGIRFVGAGFLVFPIGLLTSALLHEVFGLREEIAAGGAFCVMLCVSFILARTFIFRSAGTGEVNRQLPRFLLISFGMRGAEYLMFLALFRTFAIPYLFAMVMAVAASSLFKFFLYRVWVFGRPVASE